MSYSYPMTSDDVTSLNATVTSYQTQMIDLMNKYDALSRSLGVNPSNKVLSSRISNLENVTRGLSSMSQDLTQNTNARTTLSDLKRTEDTLSESINNNSRAIAKLEEKLSKVLLPQDTRYYLGVGEVEEFQTIFAKMKAMMVKFETLYKQLVAYTLKTN